MRQDQNQPASEMTIGWATHEVCHRASLGIDKKRERQAGLSCGMNIPEMAPCDLEAPPEEGKYQLALISPITSITSILTR